MWCESIRNMKWRAPIPTTHKRLPTNASQPSTRVLRRFPGHSLSSEKTDRSQIDHWPTMNRPTPTFLFRLVFSSKTFMRSLKLLPSSLLLFSSAATTTPTTLSPSLTHGEDRRHYEDDSRYRHAHPSDMPPPRKRCPSLEHPVAPGRSETATPTIVFANIIKPIQCCPNNIAKCKR